MASKAFARAPRHGRDRARQSEAGEAFVQALVAAAMGDLQAGRTQAAVARLSSVPFAGTPPATARAIVSFFLATDTSAQALAWLDHILRTEPGAVDALSARARVLARMGRAEAALKAFAAAAGAGCTDPDIAFEHGTLLQSEGHHEAAIAAYDRALALRPAFPEALRAGGLLLRDRGHRDGALLFLAEAARLAPDHIDTVLDHTGLLHALDRFDEALAAYEAALVRHPAHAGLLNNKGIALQELGRLPEAREAYGAAAAADPALAQAHLNLGNTLVWSGAPAAALSSLDRAIALKSPYPEASCSRGVALRTLGRLAEAEAAFDAALAARPDFPHARTNRGELRLLLGRFAEGWPDYAERFRAGRQTRPRLPHPAPEWHGEPLQPGRRLAVLADQGNGDMIHFARYLPLLAERGLAVTFVCPARLHRLLAPVTAGITVLAEVPEDMRFDHEVTLSSLPQAFGTNLDTIPSSPGYLQAEPAAVEAWGGRIGIAGFRVGLCWRGDQRWQTDPQRSLPLAALAPLAQIRGARLFSLQLPSNLGDDAPMMAALGIDPLGSELDQGPDSFCDTAAAMASLDLVVTCDTSIAHLAGALGRPVHVLLQACPEWRWLLGRRDSPWYPSARLFRQETAGDWTVPVAAMIDAVRERL